MVEERVKRDPLEREQETPDRQMVRLVMGEVKTYIPASVRKPMDVDHDVIRRAQEPTSLTKKEHPLGCSQRLAGDPCSQIAGQCHERSINHAAKYVSSFRFLSTTRGVLPQASSVSVLPSQRLPALLTLFLLHHPLTVEPASLI